MAYAEAKVYYDGSHYIAIPHTKRKNKSRRVVVEEETTVVEKKEEGSETVKAEEPLTYLSDSEEQQSTEKEEKQSNVGEKPIGRKMTRKELFEQLYKEYIWLKKQARQSKILKEMLPYFDSEEKAKEYVKCNLERKQRNLICRRVRMARKARLANFNYFCTFTYNDALHTDESFKKSLKICFRNLCNRKGWKYMGVWERSPEKQRLHFHGLFKIPEGGMVGELEEKTDFSIKTHSKQTILQNTFFQERFGRNDFKELDKRLLGESLAYLMKYIEKSREKIVYSKGMYQYFISDIMDDDIVSTIGQEDKKLLLFDDFECWDEGCLIGKVSEETIS
ncbi:MAG: hypothetical protein NC311_08525 [Muribaculaceae bacterium]|nr:hypothetical protein [Muribaculaceae bacterium]